MWFDCSYVFISSLRMAEVSTRKKNQNTSSVVIWVIWKEETIGTNRFKFILHVVKFIFIN